MTPRNEQYLTQGDFYISEEKNARSQSFLFNSDEKTLYL